MSLNFIFQFIFIFLLFFIGFDRIQELEQSRIRSLEYPADRECDHEPRFIGDIHDLELNENENIRFALRVPEVYCLIMSELFQMLNSKCDRLHLSWSR